MGQRRVGSVLWSVFLLFVASLVVPGTSTVATAGRTDVRTTAVIPLTRTQLDMGFSHSCSLRSNGTIDCWGQNAEKQIGDYETSSFREPIDRSDLTGVTEVSVGLSYTCALMADKTVKCWGANGSGQLGSGTNSFLATPGTVTGLADITDIDAGYSRACAVTSGGTVMCWGNDAKNIGPGDLFQDSNLPYEVQGVGGATAVAVGENFTCALLSDKTVKCWGSNSDVVSPGNALPTTVAGLADVTTLSAGMKHVCAVTATGEAKCWGEGTYGQLGQGALTSSSAIVSVTGLSDATSVAAGTAQTCAIKANGTVACWGQGGLGALGNGRSDDSKTPVTVEGITSARSISVGSGSACAIDSAGLLKCWGDYNKWATEQKTPVRVRLGQSVSAPTLTSMRIGDGPRTFNATASSGLPVTVTADTITRVCEAIDGKMYALKSGTCSFSVSQEGNEDYAPVATTTSNLSVSRSFTIDPWVEPRTNVLTTLVFVTSDGQPLSGKSVTWQTTGGGDSASGGPKTTGVDGKVSFGAVSGPALITLEPQVTTNPNPDYGPGPQYLKSVSTVVVLRDGELKVDIGAKPEPDERIVKVVLPDGTPVRGAVVYNFAKEAGQRLYKYPIASERRVAQATWRSIQATSDGGLGNCQYGNTPGGSDLRAVTDRDGSATLRGWLTVETAAKIGVCYNDGELKQEKSAELAASGVTTVQLSYAAKVVVETTEAVADEAGQATVSATLVDEVGSPLTDKTVTAVQEASDGVSTAALRVLSVETSASCSPTTQAKSGKDGRVTLRICPTASGYWYLKASGLVPSKSFYVRASTSTSTGKGASSPSAMPSTRGGASTGSTASAKQGMVLRARQTATGSRVATATGLTVSRGAKVTMAVARSSSRICQVLNGRLVAKRSGSCKLAVTVQPKVGKRTTRNTTVVVK